MNVHFMRKSNEWETPADVFRDLDREFHFTLDPASTDENAKCLHHYTAKEDGLAQSWDGEIVFCNPPYGREIGKWVRKAAESKAVTVMLMPARTDTSYFHEYIYGKTEIRFIRGRMKFGSSTNSAPFPSMVVVFR
jgi:site-specific DNA-methyltransferase (adenine-specific)